MAMIYTIKVCEEKEKSKLKNFLDQHWQKNHVLSKNDKLLDFQHLNNHYYNFVIGINTITDEIDGVFGFIPTWHFDADLHDDGFYSGAIWKVRQDVQNEEIAFLGNLLWKGILKLPKIKCFLASGISDQAIKFYQASRLKVDKLNQYYIPNISIDSYRIAQIPKFSPKDRSQNVRIKELSFTEIPELNHTGYPGKSIEYIKNRYEFHPFYKYYFYGVYIKDELQTVWICRIVEAEGSCCLRIIDMYGKLNATPYVFSAIQSILIEHKAEYADCMCYGLSKQVFTDMGFMMVDFEKTDVIIPNYFEPFIRKNILIQCAHTNIEEQVVIFKGDSDQDRPNIIVEK